MDPREINGTKHSRGLPPEKSVKSTTPPLVGSVEMGSWRLPGVHYPYQAGAARLGDTLGHSHRDYTSVSGNGMPASPSNTMTFDDLIGIVKLASTRPVRVYIRVVCLVFMMILVANNHDYLYCTIQNGSPSCPAKLHLQCVVDVCVF